MPFVDLSSPNNNNANTANAKPGDDFGVPLTVASPLLDQSAPVAPPTTPVVPNVPASIAQQPAIVDAKYKEELNEEHQLMSSVPENLNSGKAAVIKDGVKEFDGPPLAGQTNPAQPPTSEMAPTIMSSAPITAPVVAPIPVSVPAPNLELQGSAQGKEKVVQQILNNADLLVDQKTQKTNNENVSPLAGNEGTPITAGEKFISEKSTLVDLLNIAIEKDASDLHVSVGYPPMYRVDGALITLGGEEMTEEHVESLFMPMLNELQSKELKEKLDVDFSYTHPSGNRFRINFFHKKGVMAGAFRLIPQHIRSVAELNLPQVLYDFINIPYGLVLVTGPTGNGKSTTLAALIEEINLNQSRHIITIEDPIEYIFPKGKSLVDQREINTDTISWTRALREVLRQDPNVVLIGEMRDYETIAAAITVAETGHLVFATLHTNSASQTLDRMIDVFPENQQQQIRAQLSNVISAVVSQRLVPINKGGRKAVVEVMIASPAVRNAIREAKTYQIDNIIQTSSDIGMIPLEKSLINLIRSGDLTLEQAQMYTIRPDELTRLLRSN